MRVLVTRPGRQALRTASRLAELGHRAIVSPLLEIRPRGWALPPGTPDALLVTSANAMAADMPEAVKTLLVLAMGEASAAAVRAAGFTHVEAVNASGAQDLYEQAAAREVRLAWHLCGRDLTEVRVPAGLSVRRISTYQADTRPLTGEAADALRAAEVDIALLYSARTAAQFAREIERLDIARSALDVALIGPALAHSIGEGWRGVRVAESANEDALLEAAALLCDR